MLHTWKLFSICSDLSPQVGRFEVQHSLGWKKPEKFVKKKKKKLGDPASIYRCAVAEPGAVRIPQDCRLLPFGCFGGE
ncbi:hypothetical protein K1719_027718 [Acacia pycnantha]|nr:hypothetical protein K1719_027718 [Acacia pycnantha]